MSDTVFERQGNELIVRPKGHLDTVTSPVLEREMQSYLDDVQEITMDFSDVEYISSGGLRTVLAAEQRMEDCGGSMQLIHVNEHILEVFDLVGFRDIVNVEES